MHRHLPLFALALVAVGCSGGAGSGKLSSVKKPSGPVIPSAVGPAIPGDAIDPVVEAAKDPPKEPTRLAVKFKEGRRETYTLANVISTFTQGAKKGEVFENKTFLNATQVAQVHKLEEGKALVSIQTFNVEAGVSGATNSEQEADDFLKKLAASIEGSTLEGHFDATGKGEDLFLMGEGVGLNPMGPQAGSQVSVGFMGVLLPKGEVKVGDTWAGTYDISQSGADLFESSGGRVTNGEIPLTYELVDYNPTTNFAKLGVSAKGRPVVKVPMNGAMAEIRMDVSVAGFALVRFDDGWLQELRLETTITTEGFVATKQIVRSVTRRQK